MTELDNELGPLALELIEEFGKLVQYTKVSEGEYDPETGSATPSGEPVDVKAIVEDYDLQGSGAGFAAGLIETGDKKLTLAGASFDEEPTPSDIFGIDGEDFTILNVKNVYSGELVALYVCQARK